MEELFEWFCELFSDGDVDGLTEGLSDGICDDEIGTSIGFGRLPSPEECSGSGPFIAEPQFGAEPEYYDGMHGYVYRSDDGGYTWNANN